MRPEEQARLAAQYLGILKHAVEQYRLFHKQLNAEGELLLETGILGALNECEAVGFGIEADRVVKRLERS